MEVSDLRDFYSTWLNGAMAARDLSQAELARQSGVSRETIWRILNDKTDADPETIDQLSAAMKWPLPSYLMTPRRGMVTISNSMADAVASLANPMKVENINFPGWLWSSITREPVEEFRDVIWNVRLLAMLLLGSRKTIPASEIRELRLAICRMTIGGCELAGRAVPQFVHDIHNALIENTFVEEEHWFQDREREAEFLKFKAEHSLDVTPPPDGPKGLGAGTEEGETVEAAAKAKDAQEKRDAG